MAVTLTDLKEHLRLSTDDEDAVLSRQLAVASVMIGQKVGGLDQFNGNIPAPIDLAILMYAAHLYSNREATTYGTQVYSLPLGVEDLISAWSFPVPLAIR